MIPRTVSIQTGARLHFGPFGFRPQSGPEFGGIGMMIRRPGYTVAMESSASNEIDVSLHLKESVEKIAAAVRQELKIEETFGIRLEVSWEIPRHVGLGSGTQLGLAIAQGISVLTGCKKLSVNELARIASRGRRSAIGIHGFHHGGFLVDDGKHADEEIGQLSHRFEFPKAWRVVLISPKNRQGISGEREGSIFDRLEPMKSTTSEELRSLVEKAIIPALKQDNFESITAALTNYGKIVGDYFSEHQGGVFSFPNSSKVCHVLDSHGVLGYGQTSWGPTMWVMQENETTAKEVVEILQEETVFQHSDFRVVEALNEGAKIDLV